MKKKKNNIQCLLLKCHLPYILLCVMPHGQANRIIIAAKAMHEHTHALGHQTHSCRSFEGCVGWLSTTSPLPKRIHERNVHDFIYIIAVVVLERWPRDATIKGPVCLAMYAVAHAAKRMGPHPPAARYRCARIYRWTIGKNAVGKGSSIDP